MECSDGYRVANLSVPLSPGLSARGSAVTYSHWLQSQCSIKVYRPLPEKHRTAANPALVPEGKAQSVLEGPFSGEPQTYWRGCWGFFREKSQPTLCFLNNSFPSHLSSTVGESSPHVARPCSQAVRLWSLEPRGSEGFGKCPCPGSQWFSNESGFAGHGVAFSVEKKAWQVTENFSKLRPK